jgi:hypothetical protein
MSLSPSGHLAELAAMFQVRAALESASFRAQPLLDVFLPVLQEYLEPTAEGVDPTLVHLCVDDGVNGLIGMSERRLFLQLSVCTVSDFKVQGYASELLHRLLRWY